MHRRLIFIVFAVVLLGLAGCNQPGDGDSDGDAFGSTSSTSAPEQTTTSADIATTTEPASPEATEVDTTTTPTTTTTGVPELLPGQVAFDDLDPLPRASAEQLISAMADTEGAWPGFSLSEYQIYIAPLNGGDPAWAVVAGFDDPNTLGLATPVQGAPHVHYVVDLTSVPDPPPNTIYNPGGELDGERTYIVAADTLDELYFFNPIEGDNFELLLEHEAFHDFQRSFESGISDQTLRSNYDVSPENIELILLEDAALVDAVQATTTPDSVDALRRFVAVRDLRHELFESTLFDDGQEWLEGTARWFTFRSGDGAPVYRNPLSTDGYTKPLTDGVPPGVGNDGLDDPTTYVDTVGGIAYQFRNERVYQTGATQLQILEQLDTPNLIARIEAGERPIEISRDVATASGPVGAAEIDAARRAYDPNGELGALAAEISELVIEDLIPRR